MNRQAAALTHLVPRHPFGQEHRKWFHPLVLLLQKLEWFHSKWTQEYICLTIRELDGWRSSKVLSRHWCHWRGFVPAGSASSSDHTPALLRGPITTSPHLCPFSSPTWQPLLPSQLNPALPPKPSSSTAWIYTMPFPHLCLGFISSSQRASSVMTRTSPCNSGVPHHHIQPSLPSRHPFPSILTTPVVFLCWASLAVTGSGWDEWIKAEPWDSSVLGLLLVLLVRDPLSLGVAKPVRASGDKGCQLLGCLSENKATQSRAEPGDRACPDGMMWVLDCNCAGCWHFSSLWAPATCLLASNWKSVVAPPSTYCGQRLGLKEIFVNLLMVCLQLCLGG